MLIRVDDRRVSDDKNKASFLQVSYSGYKVNCQLELDCGRPVKQLRIGYS